MIIVFRVVLTVLGALEVGIGCCRWVNDPGATFCSKGGHSSQGDGAGG